MIDPRARALPARSQRGSTARVLAIATLVVFLVGMLAVVAALTFSVQVSGKSMWPTLQPGDRLEVDVLHRKDVRRFDLVDAKEPDGASQIVKRVVGLPGDQVKIRLRADGRSEVLLRPAGSSTTYVVANPTWAAGQADGGSPCCTGEGTSTQAATWATVPEDAYWLIGDNWGGSTDSRVFGFVDQAAVGAKLSFRILPRDRFGRVDNPARLVPLER